MIIDVYKLLVEKIMHIKIFTMMLNKVKINLKLQTHNHFISYNENKQDKVTLIFQFTYAQLNYNVKKLNNIFKDNTKNNRPNVKNNNNKLENTNNIAYKNTKSVRQNKNVMNFTISCY